MRQTCQLKTSGGEECGKPAVDYVVREVYEEGDPAPTSWKMWLCAKHFDLLIRIQKIITGDY